MGRYASDFSHLCDQIPDQKQLMKGRVYLGSDFKGAVSRPSWWGKYGRKCGRQVHCVSIWKQDGMNAGAQLAFSIVDHLRIQPRGWCHPEVCFHGDSASHQTDNKDYHQSRIVRVRK